MNATQHMFIAQFRPVLRSLTAIAFGASLAGAQLSAQENAASSPPAPTLDDSDVILLGEFVITGSVTPRTKLESSAPVTTIDSAQLEIAAPRSTADALKLIPGFYVESSGGEANNNLFARGAPSDGGYVYVMMQEDGLLVISESDFQFSPTDNYSRINNWVRNIEAVRGGVAGVFQSSAPIGIINLITREGTSDNRGEVTVTTGDYGLLRTDVWTSGPLTENTTFAVGGFYRVDDGIRDPGYTANKGGQFSGNIRYNLPDDRGHLKISGKVLNDRTAFQLPIPLANPRDPKTIPGGPDINDGPSGSPDIRRFFFPDTPLGNIDWDMGDGIRVDLSYIGAEFEYQVTEGVKLQDRVRYTNVDKAWIANPPGAPVALQTMANNIATSPNAGNQFAGALDPANGDYRFRLTYPGQNGAVAAANAAAAANLNGNGLGMDNNFWHSGAEMSNFQNDLRLIDTVGETTISGGVYYAYLEDDRLWQWNRFVTEVTPHYRRLDVTYLDAAGNDIGAGTFGGIGQVGTLYRREGGDSKDTSFYANVEHRAGKLTVDAGVRYERYSANGQAEGVRTYDLNQPGGTNPALRGAAFGSGNFTSATFSRSETAYTAGANFTFAENAAVFARISDGYRMPDLDNVYDAALNGNPANLESSVGPTTTIKQYEAGLKLSTSKLAFFLTGFASRVRDQVFADFIVNPDGTVSNPINRIGIDIDGIELEGIYSPMRGLNLHLVTTYQKAETSTHNFVSGTDANGDPISVDIFGNRPIRIPELYGSLRASYTLAQGDWGVVSLNGAWQFIGKRYTDRANLGTLDGFDEFSAGVSFSNNRGLVVRVQASNLFNSEGLTEGDPRADQSFANPDAAYSNFRPVLPRSIIGSVSYAF